jgi:prevent-host-death family protein
MAKSARKRSVRARRRSGAAATVNIHEAKTHFSKLVARVEEGEEVVIARGGSPVARLVPFGGPPPAPRPLGIDDGTLWIADDFDAPLPAEIGAAFEADSVDDPL